MRSVLLDYGPTLLTWAAVIYKLPALRRQPGEWSVRTYWLTLLSLAITLTLLLPPAYVGVDGLLRVPNLARLLAHCLTLVASWSVQAFLSYLNYPELEAHPTVRRSGCGLLVALVLMTVFFVLAPVDEEALDFMTRYGNAPFVLEYRLIFLLYLGFALVNVVRLSWRYAGIASRPAMDLGLRIVAAGAVVGLGYVAHEAGRVVTTRLGIGYPIRDPDALTQLLVAASITLIVIGSTMPSWGTHLGIPALYDWLDRYRACRKLYPLWWMLCEAAPEIALVPPRSAIRDALDPRDLRFRLYRRVVEIRDGELALRPYLDARVAARVSALCLRSGVPPHELAEMVEAVCLGAAVRARACGLRAARPVPMGQASGEPHVAGEAAVLGKVARCHVRSPAVPAILAQLEREGFFKPRKAERLAG